MLGRKALCPPTLIPRKKTTKAMLPIVAAPKYLGEAADLRDEELLAGVKFAMAFAMCMV
jgi:hypothetical protein